MKPEIEYLAGDWVCVVGDDDHSEPHRITAVSLDGDYVRLGEGWWVEIDSIQGVPLLNESLLKIMGFQPYQLSDTLQRLTGAEHGWMLERDNAKIRIAGDHLDIRVSNGTVLPTRVVVTAHYLHELQRACLVAHVDFLTI